MGLRDTLLPAAILTLATLAMFYTSPMDEGFMWGDAPSFALNGDLVHDYVAHGLGRSPVAFANEWFLRYPALTISLYPPVFPVAEAAMFALFGFSHMAAQATVSLFVALAAWGAYAIARTALPPLPSTAAVLMLLGTGAMMVWSRQVMMEAPTMAFLCLGAAALLRYQAGARVWHLYIAVLMLVAATYTKQTAIFIAPAFVAFLLLESGWAVLRRGAVWIAAVAGTIAILPLIAFTILYAPQLIDVGVGGQYANELPRYALASIARGALDLPIIAGWGPLVLALLYMPLVAVRGWADAAERRIAALMLCWFVAAYASLSFVGHYEWRYGIFLTIPVAFLAVLFVYRLSQGLASRDIASLAGGAAIFGLGLATPLPYEQGQAAVAEAVLRHAEPGDVLLYQAYDSKSFVFSLRLRTPEPKLYVLRAEKLVVDYALTRAWGIRDRNMSETDVAALVDRAGVSLVVLQPGFWTDQPSMARLEALVTGPRFEKLEQVSLRSQEARRGGLHVVYRNRAPTQPTAETLRQLGRPG